MNQHEELECGREPLVDAITRFLAHEHASDMGEIRASLERAIDDAGPRAIDGLGRRLAGAGADWSYYPGIRWPETFTVFSLTVSCSTPRLFWAESFWILWSASRL